MENKKIHVALSSEIHQRLRVKCALECVTIQEYVEKVITEVTRDVIIPKKSVEKGTVRRS